MRRATGAVLLVALGAVVAGCGGSTTTIIERTTTVERTVPPAETANEPGSAGEALLKLSAYEHWLIEPITYGFGVSGQVAGHDLKWTGWGSDTARGTGTIWEREPGGDFSDYSKGHARAQHAQPRGNPPIPKGQGLRRA